MPAPLDLCRFLSARVASRDTFVCASTRGCGGKGNNCRIDRLVTEVAGERLRFTWGGGCSLYDRGTGRKKLPDLTPDPFREREALVAELLDRIETYGDRPRIGLTDSFNLKTSFPFFATFLSGLGLDLEVRSGGDHATLKRGIEEANVPFCAPMQQYHGLVATLAEAGPDLLFLPMIRSLPRIRDEEHAVLCPVVQASPEILRWDLAGRLSDPFRSNARTGRAGESSKNTASVGSVPRALPKLVSPVIDVGLANWRSAEFRESCLGLARSLGSQNGAFEAAFASAVAAQEAFEVRCQEIGRNALDFARRNDILAVAVLGRPYTLYNRVLNSNVPALLREQGALGVPIDCFPVDDDVPLYERAYWGYENRMLRAATQVRKTPGLYSLWCSNYACGPDSFGLHFYAHIMAGRPYAVIETDGHSGDAGTRTRVEAFLYCARQDRERSSTEVGVRQAMEERLGVPTFPPKEAPPFFADTGVLAPSSQARRQGATLHEIEQDRATLADIRELGETVLIPRMGPGNAVMAAALRGLGVPAEGLPLPDAEALAMGRRHTSGKECVPACITLGSLLQRLEKAPHPDEHFAFFMPQANGPCRFGSYNLLHKVVMERLGHRKRVRVWAPTDEDYFRGTPPGFAAAVFSGFMAEDLILEGLYHTRPVENRPGGAIEVYERYHARLVADLEARCRAELSLAGMAKNLLGDHFGCLPILEAASRDYAALVGPRTVPSVIVVGEIYVRCDPFANGFVVDALEKRGIRVRFAPFNEWIEYTDSLYRNNSGPGRWARIIRGNLQDRIRSMTWGAMAPNLGWHPRTTVKQSLHAASRYIRNNLHGEAVLTLGGPLHEWREGLIQGAVSVGPLECMPSRIAEAQFFHAAEQEGLPSLSLSVNGEGLDPEAVDAFAFRVHRLFEAGRGRAGASTGARRKQVEGAEAQRRRDEEGLVGK